MMASTAFRESLIRLAEIHERDIADAVDRAVAMAVQPLSTENRRLAAELKNLQLHCQGSALSRFQLWEPIPDMPNPTAPCAFMHTDPSVSLSTNGHSWTPPRPFSPPTDLAMFGALVDTNGCPSDSIAEPSIDDARGVSCSIDDTRGVSCVCSGARPCGEDQENGHSDTLPNWRPGVPYSATHAATILELQHWEGDLVQDGASSADGYSSTAVDGLDTGAGVTTWLYHDSCPCSQEPLDSATSTHPGTSDEEVAKPDCSAFQPRFTCSETCSCCRRLSTPKGDTARTAGVYSKDSPRHAARPRAPLPLRASTSTPVVKLPSSALHPAGRKT